MVLRDQGYHGISGFFHFWADSKLGGETSNIFYFHPYLGKISHLTNIFQMGWNHQPENIPPIKIQENQTSLCISQETSRPILDRSKVRRTRHRVITATKSFSGVAGGRHEVWFEKKVVPCCLLPVMGRDQRISASWWMFLRDVLVFLALLSHEF